MVKSKLECRTTLYRVGRRADRKQGYPALEGNVRKRRVNRLSYELTS
jgi:hypothetical protein